MDGFVSISEAAKVKNVTRQAIYLAIKLKRLKAYRHNEKWKVSLMDLQEYDARRFSRIHHSTFNGEPIFDEERGYFSVDKAAKMINIPKQKVYYAIRTGRLKASRKKAAWVVHVNDLLQYESCYIKNNCTMMRA